VPFKEDEAATYGAFDIPASKQADKVLKTSGHMPAMMCATHAAVRPPYMPQAPIPNVGVLPYRGMVIPPPRIGPTMPCTFGPPRPLLPPPLSGVPLHHGGCPLIDPMSGVPRFQGPLQGQRPLPMPKRQTGMDVGTEMPITMHAHQCEPSWPKHKKAKSPPPHGKSEQPAPALVDNEIEKLSECSKADTETAEELAASVKKKFKGKRPRGGRGGASKKKKSKLEAAKADPDGEQTKETATASDP
jgi:hypothetical protein